MKKCILVIIFLILSSVAVSADIMDTKLFDIHVESVQDKILDTTNGHGEFYLNIENKFSQPETFKFLFLDPPNWKEQLIPNPNEREITIAPGETGQFHFYVKPSRAPLGVQPVSAIFRSEVTGITFRKSFRVQYGEKETPAVITPPKPDMNISVSVPSLMDPRNAYTVVVTVQNNNERLLDNVSIMLDSKNFKDSTSVMILPDESKGVSFAVLLDHDLPPQDDDLHIIVKYENKTFYDHYNKFRIVEYLPPFDVKVDVKKSWLKRYRTITITNKGNTEKSDVVRLETSLRERLFSSSDPDYDVLKEDGKQYFTWNVSLAPGESTVVSMTTNYRLLLWLVLAILLYFIYLWKKLNPLVIKKRFKSVKKEHGAISEMSVAIYLKNTGKQSINNLRVIERVTKMVTLKKDSFEGSVHPVKMHSHDREGTLIEYRFPELGPGDERIINYKAYAKLNIFGNIVIKPTVVEFVKKSGAKMKAFSNTISIQTDKVENDSKDKGSTHSHTHKERHEHHSHHPASHHKVYDVKKK